MLTFVANATALANHFKACVLAVHHVPLADDKRMRGHTSLHGGADAELLTERNNGDLTTTLSLEKLKDEEDGIKLTVHLDRIVIGQDEDGDDVSTLVVSRVEHGEGEEPTRASRQRRFRAADASDGDDHAGHRRGRAGSPLVPRWADGARRPR